MLNFKSWGISRKLIVGFILVALITVIVGSIGWYGQNQLTDAIVGLKDENLPTVIDFNMCVYDFMKIKMGLRSFLSYERFTDEYDKQVKVIQEARDEYAKYIALYEKHSRVPEEEKLYQEMMQRLTEAVKYDNEILALAEKTMKTPANREALHKELTEMLLGEKRDIIDNLIKKMEELNSFIVRYYAQEQPEANIQMASILSTVMILTTVIGVILAVVLGVIVSRSVTRPLNRNTTDLTASSNNLEGAASQIASASQELSSGASELASSVEEITSSMEELQSIIESNTKSVNEAEVLMKETADGAQASSNRAEELLAMMNEINENSRKVVRINKVIDDIAFQTSILALNAAVEAARAGEAGRGFAVVADQVKSLAQKSAEASSETSELIETVVTNIEKGTERTRMVAEDSKNVSDAASKVNILLDEINRAFKEQSKGANQVTKAISQVNTVVQQTAASSEETASAGEELLAQVEQLREVVRSLNTLTQGEKAAGKTEIAERRGASEGRKDIKGQAYKVRQEGALKSTTRDQGNKVSKGRENGSMELITPEEKIPLEDFKDF